MATNAAFTLPQRKPSLFLSPNAELITELIISLFHFQFPCHVGFETDVLAHFSRCFAFSSNAYCIKA